MPTYTTKRPGSVWALTVLLAIQALAGIAGGYGLSADPINNVGMPLSMLEGSPFGDYLIPGLILLVFVGLFPLPVLYGLVRRRRWGWWLAVAAGAALVIWIATEGALLGYLPGAGIAMQIIFGLLGAGVVALALVPSTRRFFEVGGYASRQVASA